MKLRVKHIVATSAVVDIELPDNLTESEIDDYLNKEFNNLVLSYRKIRKYEN